MAHAWITLSQSSFGASIEGIQQQLHGTFTGHPQSGLGFIWNYPVNSSDNRGLGGGITWAWDDALCDNLLPLFREDLFFYALVTCYDLKSAMHRAFDSWAANHRAISFVDVTEQCRKLHGIVSKDCSLIEVWVSARPAGSVGSEAARATPKAVVNKGDGPAGAPFRYTNGRYATKLDAATGTQRPLWIIETIGGEMDFSTLRADGTPMCWYLDSTFCSTFHQLKKVASPDTVWSWGLGVTIVVTLGTGLCTLLETFGTVIAPWCGDAPPRPLPNSPRFLMCACASMRGL